MQSVLVGRLMAWSNLRRLLRLILDSAPLANRPIFLPELLSNVSLHVLFLPALPCFLSARILGESGCLRLPRLPHAPEILVIKPLLFTLAMTKDHVKNVCSLGHACACACVRACVCPRAPVRVCACACVLVCTGGRARGESCAQDKWRNMNMDSSTSRDKHRKSAARSRGSTSNRRVRP